MRTPFRTVRLLMSMKQCRLDGEGDLMDWVPDRESQGSNIALPAVRLDATVWETPPVPASQSLLAVL